LAHAVLGVSLFVAVALCLLMVHFPIGFGLGAVSYAIVVLSLKRTFERSGEERGILHSKAWFFVIYLALLFVAYWRLPAAAIGPNSAVIGAFGTPASASATVRGLLDLLLLLAAVQFFLWISSRNTHRGVSPAARTSLAFFVVFGIIEASLLFGGLTDYGFETTSLWLFFIIYAALPEGCVALLLQNPPPLTDRIGLEQRVGLASGAALLVAITLNMNPGLYGINEKFKDATVVYAIAGIQIVIWAVLALVKNLLASLRTRHLQG
jgi:hypothetical protein